MSNIQQPCACQIKYFFADHFDDYEKIFQPNRSCHQCGGIKTCQIHCLTQKRRKSVRMLAFPHVLVTILFTITQLNSGETVLRPIPTHSFTSLNYSSFPVLRKQYYIYSRLTGAYRTHLGKVNAGFFFLFFFLIQIDELSGNAMFHLLCYGMTELIQIQVFPNTKLFNYPS